MKYNLDANAIYNPMELWGSESSNEDISDSTSMELVNSEDSGEYYKHSELSMDDRFYTKLHLAAERGDAQKCREILIENPDAVNDSTEVGFIALDLAAMSGHIEASKVLMSCMTDYEIYKKRPDGNTTAELVVMEGHLEVLKVLIDRVPQIIYWKGNQEQTILHLAASRGQEEMCKWILEMNPSAIKDITQYGYNALHLAANKNFTEVMELFMDKMCLKDIDVSLPMKTTHTLNDGIVIGNPVLLENIGKIILGNIDQIISNKPLVMPEFDRKLLKLYTIITEGDHFKNYLDNSNQANTNLFAKIDGYIAQNYFELIGVCKTVNQESPFCMLNIDSMGVIVSNIKPCFYVPELADTSMEESDIQIQCVGEDYTT